MTLFRQIALMISTFLLIILSTVLVLNFKSANSSIKDRLYTDAKNTATTLGISLTTTNGDIGIMTTMIDASFDSGYYHYIILKDTEDNTIYKREVEQKIVDVPQWFREILDIKPPIASSNISAGWSQVGVLYVEGDNDYAYIQLYTILKNLLISFGIIAFFALISLNFLIAMILKPLKKVQLQAEAITRNEFIIQSEIPSTKEFEDVVIGMNVMVEKVKAMFDKGNEELKRQKELEYIDKDTKLKNRKYLIDKLPEFLKMDATSSGGSTMMISLSGVTEANEKIGHKEVDNLFINLANVLETYIKKYKDAIASRINGTEFCLFIPDCDEKEALEIAHKIKNDTDLMIEKMKLDNKITSVSLGLCKYHYNYTIASLLSILDNALAKAKFNSQKIYFEKDDNTLEVMGKDEWRYNIKKAIDSKSFKLIPYKTVDVKNKSIVHNTLSINMMVDDTNYIYGQFMAPANHTGMSHDIYDTILEILFKTPQYQLKDTVCSLRLAYEYLKTQDAYEHISALLKNHSKNIQFKLIIELPDKLAYEHFEHMMLYKKLFQKYGIDIGIFEFIGDSTDYKYIKELRPVYIKAEASYIISIKEQTLSAIRLITDSVGIKLIASGVNDNENLNLLLQKGVDTIQGGVTKSL
ncbi:MAG: diguanylate cyclase [Campylobacterales bacterium]|nr:diguanylate cyclase [Campylobacterales bacterium]